MHVFAGVFGRSDRGGLDMTAGRKVLLAFTGTDLDVRIGEVEGCVTEKPIESRAG